MNEKTALKEGRDFYYNDDGLMILTRGYLLKRGFCCQSGCVNCPYDFSKNIDPNIPLEYQTNFEDCDLNSDSDTNEED